MPKIEKYVTESLGAEVLVRSTNQPQTSYAVAASLLELKLKKTLMDKMEENKSINRSDIQKNLYNALVESYNSNKDIINSYDDVVTLKKGRDDQDKDEDPSAESNRGSKKRRSGKEAKSSKEPTHKESKSTSSSKGASRSQPKSSGKFAYADEHGRQVIPLDHFINNALEYLKGWSSSKKYTTSITKTKTADYGQVKWIEDNVSRIWSLVQNVRNSTDMLPTWKHQKMSQNLLEEDQSYKTRHIPFRSQKNDSYTAYPDIQGIIYEDEMNKNRLMHTDELHKFNDATLNHVLTALKDISTRIEMDYLPKRK
nr:hypothetical protein [Tanacetum cinerariifolium]